MGEETWVMGIDRLSPYSCSKVPHGDHRSGLRWLPLREAATAASSDGVLGAYEPRFAPITITA